MDFSKRWEKIEELGKGGQGKVYRVIDKNKYSKNQQDIGSLISYLSKAPSLQIERKMEYVESFRKAVVNFFQMEDLSHHGALKVLHEPEAARDPDLAEARIKKEIQAMSSVEHPNLLKILDSDPDAKWFVSQYHPKGTLGKDKNLKKFVGDFPKALRAFRPLVEGVSELHKQGLVHRDIKPQNIFLDSEDNLVLGDFGLVFFTDEHHKRISATFENVGSRDWMPGWAMTMKTDETRPTFDVFSLGKVLWSMVSGKPVLRLWYYNKPEFNLENLFPKNESMRWANYLFKKCVVEEEKDCLNNATELLDELNRVLSNLNINADLIHPKIERRCKVCGFGHYKLAADCSEGARIHNLGFRPAGNNMFKIFICSHCGNVQLFSFRDGQTPTAWQ